MKKSLAVLAVAGLATASQAQLSIDVAGVPGSGVTTWTFGGSDIAAISGTMRDNSGTTFNAGDTGQFPFGLDTILNTSYQDQVFTFTGAASVTIGGNTQGLTGIFLDDDGGSADDLGVRVATPIDYLAGDATAWTGSGTVNVDINDFALGFWSMNSTDGQAMFVGDPVEVTFRAIPAPGSLALLGLGGLAATRRRR